MEPIYMKDSYVKEFESQVKEVNDKKYIILESTAFYPNSGGQPHDTGKMIAGDRVFNVVYVGKFNNRISHEVDREGLSSGEIVKCRVDWERRYMLMRCHTAAHIISRIIFDDSGAKITGNQLGLEYSRIDFSLENFDRNRIEKWFVQANETVRKGLDVRTSFMSREELTANPELVRTMNLIVPESAERVRIVDITGFDQQACAGTHVRNTSEINKVNVIKCENKGKSNRRIYFKVE